MSEETKKKAAADTEEVMTKSDLLQLIAQMSSEQAKLIADALIESKKPYVKPEDLENEKLFREQTKRQMEQERQMKRANQRVCPHIAGCNPLSESRDVAGRTSIIWHTYDSTDVQGICTNCHRIFRDDQEDFAKWRGMPSYNKPSRAGQRDFLDPRAAREAARNPII